MAGAAALSACAKPASAPRPLTLAAAIAGPWRNAQDTARDRFRHPLETLQFWGLKPGAAVVEFWPGSGWWTDIVAPYLAATHGRYVAADLQTDQAEARTAVDAFRKRLDARPQLYGKVAITSFGATSAAVAPAASADLVIFARNVHNWMAAGIAEKAFRDAFAALKPGGALGVEEHRADPAATPDPLAANGYVPQAYVVQLAQEAGFQLAASSEINANPKDTKDHPFGVWTLPPTRLSAPRGSPPDPKFDHSRYDAIGESDRMTLRFMKPTGAGR